MIDKERIEQNIESAKGVVFSQRVLLTLVEKGMNREKAYGIVQRCSMEVWDQRKDFREVVRNDSDVIKFLSPADLDALFDYGYYIRYVDKIFEKAGLV